MEAAFAVLLLSWGLQHNGFHDMHQQVLTCWWQSHYPNSFPLLHMYSVNVLPHRQKTVQLPWDRHEVHQYHQIHCSSPGQTPFRKVLKRWYIPFALQLWYHIRANECMPSNWRHLARRFLHANTVETLYSTIYYSKYFIELNFDKSTQYVAFWTHKRHPIPRPFGRAMECLLWVLQQKLTVL